ncbi:hypothetical protein WR25_12215 [Diploscapter pachys]|uniref:DJ-1/PfpI domain-containing protein n=1 Tax=Diploscapter pachys TaxID=2018661 RepID=A0A2A2K2L9_9BILA|nr:hypothetical protein WR25_12215 [Diploscapter pachys]
MTVRAEPHASAQGKGDISTMSTAMRRVGGQEVNAPNGVALQSKPAMGLPTSAREDDGGARWITWISAPWVCRSAANIFVPQLWVGFDEPAHQRLAGFIVMHLEAHATVAEQLLFAHEEGGLLVNPGWLPTGILQGIHLAMQDGTALLYAAIVATADDPALVHQYRADRNAALLESLAGLVDGGLHKYGSVLIHGISRPAGGYVPIDPHSLQMAPDLDWQWYNDKAFMNRLGATLSPGQVKADQYSAIYYTGGHGVMWDFPDNQPLQELTRRIHERGGAVAAVCHGVVGLLNIKLGDNSLLLKGRRVTGFSNTEEKLVELDKVVPFLTENELGARGGEYSKADDPWAPYVVEDGSLITGQNPASSTKVAEAVIRYLNRQQ